MKFYGYCEKCLAPVFQHIDPDIDVYKVRSLRCWNGHYHEIINIHFSEMPFVYKDKNVIHITNLLQKKLSKKQPYPVKRCLVK